MSLIDSKYLEGTSKGIVGRHGAHYKLKARAYDGTLVPWMALYNVSPSAQDKICPNCFRTPFSNETEICPRCGLRLDEG